MKPDPPVRADGRCYVCGQPRRPERSRRYAKDAAVSDPFCSNTCARSYHGNPLPETHLDRPRGHGTLSEYTNKGCRCDACRAAMKAYTRRRRAGSGLQDPS